MYKPPYEGDILTNSSHCYARKKKKKIIIIVGDGFVIFTRAGSRRKNCF
jgi:predicted AlkP superfamily pyrophosphatase or phosphodiesterase